MKYTDVKIPKGGGKFRRISMPDEELKKAQREQLPWLEKWYTEDSVRNGVEGIAHGFIPEHNVVTAATKHIGFKCTIMMDLKEFFDTVKVKDLPINFIGRNLFHDEGHAAQGFPTSPMVSNVAAIPMLVKIKKLLDKKDCVFTMYADDIQVSLNTTSKVALNKVIKDITKIVASCGFIINERKTRIRYAKFGWRRILGVNVGETEVRATRKTMRKIRAAKHQGNRKSLAGLSNWSRCTLPKVKG